ncbi:PAS domain S-box protein [Sediminibacterium sp. WSJ-3]|nr:PAS domain S-box protein [Sediminibacterium soli]
MFIYDSENYRFLEANHSALRQYGYTKEVFLGMTPLDLRPKSEWPAFYKATDASPGQYYDAGRFLHTNAAGKEFFVQVYAYRTVFAGRPAVLVTAIDIDEKVRTENRLKESIEQNETILDSITDAFYTVDDEWRYTYVNKAYERLHKRPSSEVIGKVVWDVFPYGKELKFYDEFQKVKTTLRGVHFEEYVPQRDMWVRVNAYPGPDNGVAVYFMDITQEKRLEQQVFDDQQHLLAIINNTPDIIWSVDKHYNIQVGNDAFWKRVSEITGKTETKATNADYSSSLLAEWKSLFERAMKGESYGMVYEAEIQGQTRYADINFNPIYDRGGKVTGISCFSHDITIQKKNLLRIQAQNKRLRDIAWMQSHQVRNHVANIVGILGLIDKTTLTDEHSRHMFNLLKNAANQLDQTIREIAARTEEEKI